MMAKQFGLTDLTAGDSWTAAQCGQMDLVDIVTAMEHGSGRMVLVDTGMEMGNELDRMDLVDGGSRMEGIADLMGSEAFAA